MASAINGEVGIECKKISGEKDNKDEPDNTLVNFLLDIGADLQRVTFAIHRQADSVKAEFINIYRPSISIH
jgi:hypothetical protein